MKVNTSTKNYIVGMALACGLFMGPSLVNAAPCNSTSTPPAATETAPGSLTPGYTGVLFDQLYCGNDPNPFSGSYINGSPSLVKFNSDGESLTGFDDGTEGVASSFGSPGQFSYIDNVIFSNLIYNGDDLIGGTWTWTSDVGELFPKIMLLKAGDSFFIQSVAGLLSGTFSTLGLLDGKNLSHISFYDTGRSGSTPEVPLPAGILLLLSALGGLGVLIRFQKVNVAA